SPWQRPVAPFARSFFSSKTAEMPRRARSHKRPTPVAPPPMITTCVFSIRIGSASELSTTPAKRPNKTCSHPGIGEENAPSERRKYGSAKEVAAGGVGEELSSRL